MKKSKKPEIRSCTVLVRVTPSLLEVLDAWRADYGMSRSAACVHALRELTGSQPRRWEAKQPQFSVAIAGKE